MHTLWAFQMIAAIRKQERLKALVKSGLEREKYKPVFCCLAEYNGKCLQF